MEKKSKKILIGVIISIILIIAIIIFVSISFVIKYLNKTSTLDYYIVDNEKVTAITSVVGKRKVNGVSSSISNGIYTKKYSYKNIENAKGDIRAYINKLMDEEFINTTNIDLNNNSDEIKLAKKSENDNEIIILTINYNEFGYIIKIEKGKGSIQPYN